LPWIRLDGVVVDPHRRKLWQQANEILAPAVVALHYLLARDIVAAARDALAHAFGVELDILETGKPDVHGEALGCRTLEKLSHGLAAEGGLEGEVQMLVDRALNSAAEEQMVKLFNELIAIENINTGIGRFERKLRELVIAYDTAAALIAVLKDERFSATPASKEE